MSRKHSHAGSILRGVVCGGVLGCILSFSVADSDFGNRMLNSFGFQDIGARFLVVLVLVPASTLVGAIIGALIMWLWRDRE